MSYLSSIEANSLKLAGHCSHVMQGETSPATLLYNKESDGTLCNFSPALIIAPGTWAKFPVRPDFDVVNDGDVIFTEELQLSENIITAAQANLVQAVDIGTQRFLARLLVEPSGLRRYRRFALKPMQTLGRITQTVLASQFTDDGGTSGTKTLTTQIPAGALFQYSQAFANVAFSGNVSATLQIGDGSDADRYNTGTPSVFTAGQKDAGIPSGTRTHTVATTVTLTITTATDFTLVNPLGSLTVDLFYTL